ncbi:hypothetical protein DRE_04636 [Drechslerella stenobrocha 248]|uniref:DUF1014 domain protein n=1 Tax=Drechslerella stenobrocha 248 TaxID=1043628 RepID=W7I0Q3_9PEZI|nr:hypothetical protein DRE_04636 [Drechslerella stenobrocha 248]
MGGKPKGENSKKAAGQARKAEAAASKQAKADSARAAKDDAEWAEGSKDNSKKYSPAMPHPPPTKDQKLTYRTDRQQRPKSAKPPPKSKAELAAETAALKTAKTNPKAGSKSKSPTSTTPSTSLDAALAALDAPSSSTSISASGIDDALDALSLTTTPASSTAVDRHPERRFKAAFAAFEERRLAEGRADGSWTGLRLQQVQERIRREFERSDENPFNQTTVRFDASRADVAAVRNSEREKIERRLGGN